MHAEVRTVARISCEELERTPGLAIYNNCAEGSGQITNSLIFYKECKERVPIRYLGGAQRFPETIKPPFLMIYGKKCDPFDPNSISATHVLPMDHWTIIKNLRP
jgi:hypothetical protein